MPLKNTLVYSVMNNLDKHNVFTSSVDDNSNYKLECGPMPNVMSALPTTGGALCSTPQFG